MRLYIIRHGETQWNVEGRLQGQTDIELNENGIRLARITAEGMRDIPFDLAITSSLSRARKTAELILMGRNLPIIEDERLRELSFGDWEGRGCHKENFELPERFWEFYRSPFTFLPGEGGETIPALCERTGEFWEELIHNPDYQDKTILIASHGCAVRALLHCIYEDKTDFWHGGVPMNCAVNIVDVTDQKAILCEEDKVYYGKEDCVDFYSFK